MDAMSLQAHVAFYGVTSFQSSLELSRAFLIAIRAKNAIKKPSAHCDLGEKA